MSWQLTVKTPDGSSTRATYSDTAPGGIVDGFEWTVRGDGAPLQLRFKAQPSAVDIQPRDIIELVVDGKPAFWGYASRTWPAAEQDVRDYIGLGGVELLRYRSHIDPTSYDEQDVAAIARKVVEAYKHPAIIYDPALIPDLGDTIAMPQAYRLEVGSILDTLARVVSDKSVMWGVDAQGRAYFGTRSTSTEVNYSESNVRWQPVDAQDVVTRVDLVLATADEPIADSYDSWIVGAGGVITPDADFGSVPIVIPAVDSDHDADIGSQRVYAGQNLLYVGDRPSSITSSLFDNPSNAIDSDTDTYASNNNTNTSSASMTATIAGDGNDCIYGAYGVQIDYQLIEGAILEIILIYAVGDGSSSVQFKRRAYWRITSNGSGRARFRSLVMPMCKGAMMRSISTSVHVWATIDDADQFRIYDIRWLQADIDGAKKYAKSLLKSSAQKPALVAFDRYQAPTRYMTIVGAPGGDITHEVKRWRYAWRRDRLESVAEVGDRLDDDLTIAVARVADLNTAQALNISRSLTEVK